MITANRENLSGVEFKEETFGELFECNCEGAVFEDCAFTGAVTVCNFAKVVFVNCNFGDATFIGCCFAGATGLNPAEITGDANNFEGVV